ncbi:hypothetical protein FB45DRAFT_905503 [Roridomyces roridus]|uniref:Uncharacterized protein n=1 Tax=Roridomyces roridus TaxID=1738132 RepID=A0AAD7C5T6_9AGAR|nr:hypothetical protein FB45DRAFT_905503 [Roridomyces roridus]
MVHLPQELIDAIVDNVANTKEWHQAQDLDTLKACALAARVFVVPCQRHLFRSYVLRPHRVTDICTRLIGSPTLASYIQDLEISIWSKALDTTIIELLASFFPLLTRLDRLVVDWCYHSPNWALCPTTLRTALIGILSRPTLRCLGLRDCPSMPASVIRHALASFQEVAFIHISVYEDETSPLMAKVPRGNASLRRLLIRPILKGPGEDTTLQTFLLGERSGGFLRGLQHLQLSLSHPGTLERCEEIARACSTSLQHMVIDFNTMQYHPIPPLPNMPAMRVLTLVCCARRLRITTPLRSIVASLPVCMPGLEAVNLVLDSDILDSAQPNHKNMDEALGNLPSLRKVHFTIACSHHASRDIADVYRKTLPLTESVGLLSFKICDVDGLPSRAHTMYCFSN